MKWRERGEYNWAKLILVESREKELRKSINWHRNNSLSDENVEHTVAKQKWFEDRNVK